MKIKLCVKTAIISLITILDELMQDQVVGEIIAYQAEDPQLIWENDQPHGD